MSDKPNATLVLETAFPSVSMALRLGTTVFEPRISTDAARAAALHAAIADCLDQAEITARDVTEAWIDLGPGSYTGLRVGIAALRTWSFVHPLHTKALYSTDLVAARAEAYVARGVPFSVVADARRGQWFHARYTFDVDGVLTRLGEPSCLQVEEVLQRIGEGPFVSAEAVGIRDGGAEVVGVPLARDAFAIEELVFEDRELAPRYLMPAL